jgi:TolC family type I secretion outer membrane protein
MPSLNRSTLLRSVTAALACLGMSGLAPLHAMTFSQAYEAARGFDAGFRAAGHERDAAHMGVPIARAALLPSLSLTATETSVQGNRQFANALNQEVRTRLDYQAPQASLSLRMPLFNYEALSAFKQAQAQTVVADEVYRGQGMELIDRLAGAYLQVMLSAETLALNRAQADMLQTQLNQARQREARGEGTVVQVAQLQAAVDVVKTRILESEDQLELAYRQLSRLTGVQATRLAALPATVYIHPLMPQRLGEWLDMAVRQSPMLLARQQSLEVARLGVKRQYAGHLPRLDAVGSLSRSQNDSSSNVGQSTSLRTIGLQLTVPLFSGGGVEASVKQASMRLSQIEEDLRSEREALEVDVQRFFHAVNSGTQKIAAYQTAVQSSELALQGARRSLELGLGTASDLADAQVQYFVARRDLAQARIEQVLARVRLLVRAGVPMADVAAEVDAALMLGPAVPSASPAGPAIPASPARTTTAQPDPLPTNLSAAVADKPVVLSGAADTPLTLARSAPETRDW